VRLIAGSGTAAIVERDDASPLGSAAAVPVIERDAATPDEWTAVLVTLDAAQAGSPERAALAFDDGQVAVTWPDGRNTAHDLTLFRSATPADR